MKKAFYACSLLLILLMRQLPASGQNSFAPIGAEWWFYDDVSVNWAFPSYQRNNIFHTRSLSDTLIDGITCRKVRTESNSETKYYFTPDSTSVEQGHYTLDHYFYDNTDTVFIYNNYFQRFTPLYVWNAHEGDTICLPVVEPPVLNNPVNPITGDASFCFVIDSIRLVRYDTAWFRTFYTNAIQVYDSSADLFLAYAWNGTGPWGSGEPNLRTEGKYIERIIGGFFPSLVATSIADWSYFPMAPYGTLRCYSDNAYNIKLTTEPCDTLPSLTSINGPQTAANILKLYPNPAAQQFQVLLNQAMDEDLRITITDIAGRVVQQTLLPKKTRQKMIDVRQWAAGVYFLRFQAKEGIYYDKIVIRNDAGQ